MESSDDPERKLFTALVTLFKPHVAAVQWPKIVKAARRPYGFDETAVTLLFPFTPMVLYAMMKWKHDGVLFESIISMFGEWLKALFHLPRTSWRTIKANKERWLTEATAQFVRGWLWTLSDVTPIRNIDDAMLPVRLPGMHDPTAIIRTYSGEQLSSEEIRAVLRAVKALLPAGQRLPPQALEIIEIEKRLF